MLNKADRPTARPAQVEDELFELFANLDATDEQIEYPLLYASAKQGWAQTEVPTPPSEEEALPPANTTEGARMTPLFETIVDHVPPPTHLDRSQPFSMLTVQIESDPYVGNLYLGRIQSGTLKLGDTLWALDDTGKKVGDGKVKKIYSRIGLERNECETAAAGEIISIAGIKDGGVNISLVSPDGWEDGPRPLEVCLYRTSLSVSHCPRLRL